MPLPYVELKYMTEDIVREWKSAGSGFKMPNPVPALRFLYELCSTLVRGELPFPKGKTSLDSIEFSDNKSKEEVGSILADIVAHMGQDITMPGEHRSRLIKLAKWLVESNLVPVRLFQERCEEEFLWDSEMIKIKAQDLKAKEVRVNTRLLYQQTKFNLLREESEGYAKLVTLLCRSGSEAFTHSTALAVISIIKSLIGHFDLDPNRVFDIVLECFELQPDNNLFFDLIPIFPKSHASQILGFKFQYYQRMEVNDHVPFGLYRLTAVLVKSEFIDLDSIYAHLLPKDDEAFEHYEAFSAKRFEEANKIGKINLAATGKDLMDDEKQGDVTIDLFAALDTENEAVAERAPELEKNQKLGLLHGFLSVDDWYHAHILFDRFSPLNPVEHIQICEGLFRMIEKSISPAYAIIRQSSQQSCGSDTLEPAVASLFPSSFIALPRELFQMLACAGPYLYRDSLLLQKVCRVLRRDYLSVQELVATAAGAVIPESGDHGARDPRLQLKEARSRVEEALGTCLLPSLQLIPANPAVGQEIWELMSLLPYEVRYRLYGEWEKDDEQIPMVLAARQTARLDTRRILKRLAKENLKQLGRMVAKLAHANPMTVLRTIVHQIEAYRDMIVPVVDAFKYLTQLEYDMLEYVVIERLAQGGREKLKDDGLNLSDWLQSLASFWGHLCKKYPSMELRGLFQYLVNQLKKGRGIELVVLQELIQQMANVQYTENMTEEQLDAMAGGETLRYQATSFGITRNNKALIKSTNRLRDSLLPKDEPKLAIPLLLLIAQHRSTIVIHADVPYIKMVSEEFDRCHGTLLQYVEFLSSAVTPAAVYPQLVPTLDDLIHKYHLDPEVVFLIYRPVMRFFKCSRGGSDIFWPSNTVDETNISYTNGEVESSISFDEVSLDLRSPRKAIMWSDLLGTVRSMLPSKAWNSLSPDLYATFWGLTLYDLYIPKNRYESEIAKQHVALKALEEISDNSSSAITKRKKDKERIQEVLDRLTNELQKHEENVASVRRRLAHEKDTWLTSCPDTLKINMEFLQRCIFPRCIFSMPDAVYCAMFVHTLHSLGTPFFNTVNHIDVLICKTLHPMICCCTEFEAGRLGRFLYETLKMAYHWKSDESIYERECGNMPGFAVYYRDPNSQRVTFSQFIKVHWKWSTRLTRLLIQCLESAEYMEIRNALITLTKISSVFPVTRKSGINIEKRVAKIKGDEREDLKVLATGVAAALAARKSSWVSEEEFGMGHIDIKPAASPAKALVGHLTAVSNASSLNTSQGDVSGVRSVATGTQHPDAGISVKDQQSRAKLVDGRLERSESGALVKPEAGHAKLKVGSLANSGEPQLTIPTGSAQPGLGRQPVALKNTEEITKGAIQDDNMTKNSLKATLESESRPQIKRVAPSGSLLKQQKQELVKDDLKSAKSANRVTGPLLHSMSDRDSAANTSVATSNGSTIPASVAGKVRISMDTHGDQSKMESGAPNMRVSGGKDIDEVEPPEGSRSFPSRTSVSPLPDESLAAARSGDKLQKRPSPVEEISRPNKHRKGDSEDPEKNDDQTLNRSTERLLDRLKDKGIDRFDRDQKERLERPDKSRIDDILGDKSRDRSIERYGRERSVERMQERGGERGFERANDKIKDDRNKDDRNKPRYGETSSDKSHPDDRFHGQSLPPPPPLPPNIVPQSVNVSRRDEETDRRISSARHIQRLSPRHEEKERRRSEENMLVSLDDAKRRREDDFRERKRDEREGLSMKVEERERDKGNLLKEDLDAATASKKRRLKRDHLSSSEVGGEYTLAAPPPPLPSLSMGISQSYDGRERGDRKGGVVQRATYMEDPVPRMHSKEAVAKIPRRDNDPMYDRDWEDEKRQRAEPKRRHRK